MAFLSIIHVVVRTNIRTHEPDLLNIADHLVSSKI